MKRSGLENMITDFRIAYQVTDFLYGLETRLQAGTLRRLGQQQEIVLFPKVSRPALGPT
jgi:hypothetical protein